VPNARARRWLRTTDGVRRFLEWAGREGRTPTLDRPTVAAFVAALLAEGAEPATARSRHFSVRRFSAWLADEEEIPEDRLLGSKPPKLDTKVIEPLPEDDIRRLVKACAGRDLRDRRDQAIVRFMLETGARAGEVVGLTLDDIDLQAGTAIIHRGKGGKGRVVPFRSADRPGNRQIRPRATGPWRPTRSR
jgi:integrase/recombinase XerD